uniref:Uncharacterized protein n=1 Tax=Human betaherpesvirus 6 TaxID=10368 RepID=A0A5P9U7H9_9BETA|nr:hypothetical protein [Human betaherpesvirus 6]
MAVSHFSPVPNSFTPLSFSRHTVLNPCTTFVLQKKRTDGNKLIRPYGISTITRTIHLMF